VSHGLLLSSVYYLLCSVSFSYIDNLCKITADPSP
jgi:hypothetical protein